MEDHTLIIILLFAIGMVVAFAAGAIIMGGFMAGVHVVP